MANETVTIASAGDPAQPLARPSRVAARCPFGYPAVVETSPALAGGARNPTPLFLTCPELAEQVERAEGAGMVEELRTACRTQGPLHRLLGRVGELCKEGPPTHPVGTERRSTVRTPRLGAGMGGPEGVESISCLHAYAAAVLAVLGGYLAEPSQKDKELAQQVEAAWERFLPPLEACWCRDGRCSKWDTGQRRGVIDMGAISVRLLVADVMNGRPWTRLRRAEVTRLGEGLEPGGPLSEVGRRRTAAAVARFADEARNCGVDSLVLAGTAVTRQAKNGREFTNDLGRENALPSVVLTETREAELTYTGVRLGIPDRPVVLCVGGWDWTLMVQAESGLIERAASDLGAGRATEKWIRSDPPSVKETAHIHHEAAKAFYDLRSSFGADAGRRRLVGVAGTITTLACLEAGLERYESDALHLRKLSLESVRTLAALLQVMTTGERAALPGMQAGRAPLIGGGALIVEAAMEMLGYETLTVSEHGLLDGLALRGVLPPI